MHGYIPLPSNYITSPYPCKYNMKEMNVNSIARVDVKRKDGKCEKSSVTGCYFNQFSPTDTANNDEVLEMLNFE
eukprot:scaffold33242_cov122-Cyclotella_meneghiniana.AAC.1